MQVSGEPSQRQCASAAVVVVCVQCVVREREEKRRKVWCGVACVQVVCACGCESVAGSGVCRQCGRCAREPSKCKGMKAGSTEESRQCVRSACVQNGVCVCRQNRKMNLNHSSRIVCGLWVCLELERHHKETIWQTTTPNKTGNPDI